MIDDRTERDGHRLDGRAHRRGGAGQTLARFSRTAAPTAAAREFDRAKASRADAGRQYERSLAALTKKGKKRRPALAR